MALAYIDARAVMDRLDAACGPDGWQCRYPHANGKTVCDIGIRLAGDWIWKSDGAGDSDMEAEKGALSDAFKRAAVRWGVGRYLYDLDSPWIAIKKIGEKSVKIEEAELKKLAELHDQTAQRIGWGPRPGIVCYRLLLQVIKDTVTQPSDVPVFLAKHAGMIPQLPVAMRRHLQQELDRVGGASDQEAA